MMEQFGPPAHAFDDVDDLIISFARDTEARDPYTRGHCARVAAMRRRSALPCSCPMRI